MILVRGVVESRVSKKRETWGFDEDPDLRPGNADGVGGSGGHFSKSVRSGAPPVISVDVQRATRVYTSPSKWPTRPWLVEKPAIDNLYSINIHYTR